ncbi:hypothetical protein [Marinobacter mobilis]|uniref:Uncharacterized protein n=1 Tax=Marinobacter mobilis TaxID=488533 RepID=A0A1H2YXP6_9GAMM|nr:hypothetical protein [Marinobacter mobilis]SDX09962.1 hypothetical protein SAMN04487960_106115 [Marinobacter mobilis]
MRQVFNKALNAFGQLKSRPLDRKGESEKKADSAEAERATWDMSPEDALRVGTVAGYK